MPPKRGQIGAHGAILPETYDEDDEYLADFVVKKEEDGNACDVISDKKRKLEQTIVTEKEEEEGDSSDPRATEPVVKNHLDHINDPSYDPYPQICFYKMWE